MKKTFILAAALIFNFQFSISNFQLSTFNFQFSTYNYQGLMLSPRMNVALDR